jgi:hypothetical protein
MEARDIAPWVVSESSLGLIDLNSDWDSDESTKGDTRDSVSTPNGSEFSAEITFSHAMMRRRAPRSLRRSFTTLFLQKVPDFLTQGALVSQLEDLSHCMRGTFDFFYCPWNPYQNCNFGYSIINFFDHECAEAFIQEWANKDMETGLTSSGGLDIRPAVLQGCSACLQHFSGFTLAHHRDLRFRPLIRVGRNVPLQAMAVASELVQDFHPPTSNDV